MTRKKAAPGASGKMSATRRQAIERLHRRFETMRGGAIPTQGRGAAAASPTRGGIAAAAPAAAAATATVTFSSSNGNHLVQISVGSQSAAAKGSVSIGLPAGARTIVGWQVAGTGPFTLTAVGGTLDGPVSSVASDAGVIGVTVP